MMINDIEIFWQRLERSPVRLGLYFKAGGIFQKTGQDGIAHLVEHVLMANPLVRELYSRFFTTVNAYTTKEFIYLHIVSPNGANFFNEVWPLVSQLLMSPVINDDLVQREVDIIRTELANISTDYPNTNQMILHDFLASSNLHPNSYGLVEGNLDKLASYAAEDIRKYFTKHLAKPSSVVIVGDIPTYEESIDLLLEPFKHAYSIATNPLRLRSRSLQRAINVNDPFSQDTSEYACVGLGWSYDFVNPETYLAQMIFFSSVASPQGELYKSLREKESLVYDFLLDQDVINRRLSLFSIHTFVPRHLKDTYIRSIKNHLRDKHSLAKGVEWQLNYYKATVRQIYDGSQELFNFYNYYQRLGLTATDYEEIVNELSVSKIMSICKNIDLRTAAKVIS